MPTYSSASSPSINNLCAHHTMTKPENEHNNTTILAKYRHIQVINRPGSGFCTDPGSHVAFSRHICVVPSGLGSFFFHEPYWPVIA